VLPAAAAAQAAAVRLLPAVASYGKAAAQETYQRQQQQRQILPAIHRTALLMLTMWMMTCLQGGMTSLLCLAEHLQRKHTLLGYLYGDLGSLLDLAKPPAAAAAAAGLLPASLLSQTFRH
jgi:hypothetical protein